MATDNILTRKGEAPVTYDTNRGGEIQADGGPYIGIIKHNEDPLRMGRVMVYINELSDADENDPTQWILLSYMSPFFGYTPHDLQTTKESKFDNNAHAYGMWFPPPDVDVSVMCIFPKGDFQTQGFYIGCIPEPQINHMVPGYGSAPADRVSYNNQQEQASYAGGSATALPVVEIPKSRSEMNNADFYKTAKPVNTVIAAQLDFQGLIGDNVRGPITTSSQRETPSYSYGISTPGRPILESGYHENTMRSAIEGGGTTDNDFNVTGRRSGHSFVMDDGDVDGNDVLMRLRTSSGHQFSLSDNGQCIYITHANGQTWMEFGNEGTIDLFSTNSINLRSHGDVNIHADQDINMYAKRNVNSFSGSHTKIEAGKTYTSLSKERTDIYSSQVINVKSDGTLAMHSSKLTSIFAENDEVDIKGEAIQLNSGSGSSIAKPASIQKISTADTYKSAIGWFSEEGLLRTITSRTPTHEPYSGHNAGVNIAVPQTLGTPAGAKVTNPPSPGIASVTSNASSPLPSSEQTSRADVIKRAKSSPSLQDIGNASKEEIAGTIAQVEKTLEETGTVFEKAIKMTPEFLVKHNLIKPGTDFLNKTASEQLDMLKDPALFSGLAGVAKFEDLQDSVLRSKLFTNAMEVDFKGMVNDGLMHGVEDVKETASMLGASLTGASTAELKSFVNGTITGAIGSKLSSLSKAAQFGSNIVSQGAEYVKDIASGISIPNISPTDIGTKALGKVKSMISGVLDGGPIKKLSETAIATINNTNLVQSANNLIQNVKIPSFDNFSTKIVNNLKATIPNITETIKSNTVGKVVNMAQGAVKAATGAINTAQGAVTKIRNFF